jgi:hypothetical protein
MNEFIEAGLLLVCAYAIFKAGSHYAIYRIQQDLIAYENGELELEDDNEDESEEHETSEFMKIIKNENVFYAYGKGDRFLTQGDDLKELFSRIKYMFPGTTWLISQDSDTLSKAEQDSIMPILQSIFEGKDK